MESTDIVLLETHHMMGHQTMDVSTVMAEFYEAFQVNKEGPSLTLLPTMMPIRILDATFRFVKDTSDDTTNQNTGQTTTCNIPTESVGFPDTAYDYRSITRRANKSCRKCMALIFWSRVPISLGSNGRPFMRSPKF